jgi:hypothetical protein
MTNLGLEPLPLKGTDEQTHWQTTDDVPDLRTFLSRLNRSDDHIKETPEWIIAPLTHCFFNSTKQRNRLKELIQKGKHLNSKALMCLWTRTNKNVEEQQADQIKRWMRDIGWETKSGQIRNEQHDGYLEGRSACLIAANRQIVNRLPEQFEESNDGCHYLEQIVDLGDGIIVDCFSYFTAIDTTGIQAAKDRI